MYIFQKTDLSFHPKYKEQGDGALNENNNMKKEKRLGVHA